MVNLAYINSLDSEKLKEDLLKCSGSRVWTEDLQGQRPFSSAEELERKSSAAWKKLTHKDWLEAFAHHPKIGDLESLRKKFATTANWASNEQSAMSSASEQIIKKLAVGNEQYQDKFGYIFIVCATGKTAPEMLCLLEERLANTPEVEFEIACREQQKITQLRLEKLTP